MYLSDGVRLNLADDAERRTLLESRLGFADHATRCGCRVPADDRSDRSGRPAIQPEDFGMGTMVSPNGLAVAVQLPAQLRRPCVYADHAVGGIGAGPQRLRSLPHPVESDGHAALGARSQRDGRGDDYGGHRDLIQWLSEQFLRAVLPCPRHVRRGVHLLQAQLRRGRRWSRRCTRR